MLFSVPYRNRSQDLQGRPAQSPRLPAGNDFSISVIILCDKVHPSKLTSITPVTFERL